MRIELLLVIPLLMGSGGDHTCQGGHNCNDGGTGAQEQVQDQGQTQTQATEQTAEGGNALVETGDISVSSTNKRRAPAVTIISSPSTADFMVCYGLGGSGTSGAATGVWCRIEKTLYANHTAERLAAMGLYGPAAEAWCEPKLNRRSFESKEDCELQYALALHPVEEYSVMSAEPMTVAQISEEQAEQRTEEAVDRERKEHVDHLDQLLRHIDQQDQQQEAQRQMIQRQDDYFDHRASKRAAAREALKGED